MSTVKIGHFQAYLDGNKTPINYKVIFDIEEESFKITLRGEIYCFKSLSFMYSWLESIYFPTYENIMDRLEFNVTLED
jgi:hypothetical protein